MFDLFLSKRPYRVRRVPGHRIALVVCGVLASVTGPLTLRAQTPVVDSAAADTIAPVREVWVKTGAARITVFRQGVKPVRVRVRTDSGTFTLSADSAIVANWADSAASLASPTDTAKGAKMSFKLWQIRADGDSGAHMRFVRLPTNHGTTLALAVSNGVWGDIQPLGSQEPVVLGALRGESILTTDTAHVGSRVRPVHSRAAECNSAPSAHAGSFGSASDTSCAPQPVEQQASQRSDSPRPFYPRALWQAGIDGAANLQFVVDTTGRVDSRTIQLLASTDYRFALACRKALLDMLYTPARIDGRKVRELVQQPFNFYRHKPKEQPAG